MVKVSDHGRHVMSSSPVPLKTHWLENANVRTLNLHKFALAPLHKASSEAPRIRTHDLSEVRGHVFVTRSSATVATYPSEREQRKEYMQLICCEFDPGAVDAVAEWYRYRTVACFVTGSSPVPLKTRRVGQRCTLNLSRAETSSRWCGVVVRRGGTSSGVVHVT
ncbi:uncharacterized protein TNCV_2853001 [Trichonephila clavipes]|uniref:Uncharacterized protein n=1 Tax=Trichonephila clavipes TaxID=2585209 RepID=A0A8X6R6G4_TRICX|nr:uncharacterized protein TNCV_2853001 [Trichonephila clavipes]